MIKELVQAWIIAQLLLKIIIIYDSRSTGISIIKVL